MLGMVIGFALAALLELVGLALAGLGFHRTWTEHAPGQDFWAPMKRGVRSTARRVERFARRVFRRPRDVKIVTGAGHITAAAGTASIRASVGWPGLRLQVVGWTFLLVGILVGAIVNVADHVWVA